MELPISTSFSQQFLLNNNMINSNDLVILLEHCGKNDARMVGKRACELGELAGSISAVPKGFVVTPRSFQTFCRHNNLIAKINHLLGTVNFNDSNSVLQVSKTIRKLIRTSEVPREVTDEIFRLYKKLGLSGVQIYSQNEDFLHATGESGTVEKIREAWADSYSPRQLSGNFKVNRNFEHIFPSVLVLSAVHPQKSGVLYTSGPEEDKDTLVIEAVFGVYTKESEQCRDSYTVKKPGLVPKEGIDPGWSIVNANCREQKMQYVLTEEGVEKTESKHVPAGQKLAENEIKKLCLIAQKLEDVFYFPKKAEWILEEGKLFIINVQDLPLWEQKKEYVEPFAHNPIFDTAPQKILHGVSVKKGMGIGRVKLIRNLSDAKNISPDSVAVVSTLDQKLSAALTKAKAIIVKDSKNYVSSDFQAPVIKGVGTSVLKQDMLITVNGNTGDIYTGSMKVGLPLEKPGALSAVKIIADISATKKSAEADGADGIYFSPEEIILDFGIHPKRLAHEGREKELSKKILEALGGYKRNVFYKLAGLTTHEFRSLSGGKEFEEEEENYMLGLRGASRILKDKELMGVELSVLKELVQTGTNINVILPFVRNAHELALFKKILADHNFSRSVKVFIMVDIPSNVISLHEFISEGLSGCIINTETLAALNLGTDYKNPHVKLDFDLLDPSVLWSIEKVLTQLREYGLEAGIKSNDPSFLMDIAGRTISWGGQFMIAPEKEVGNIRKMVRIEEQRVL